MSGGAAVSLAYLSNVPGGARRARLCVHDVSGRTRPVSRVRGGGRARLLPRRRRPGPTRHRRVRVRVGVVFFAASPPPFVASRTRLRRRTWRLVCHPPADRAATAALREDRRPAWREDHRRRRRAGRSPTPLFAAERDGSVMGSGLVTSALDRPTRGAARRRRRAPLVSRRGPALSVRGAVSPRGRGRACARASVRSRMFSSTTASASSQARGVREGVADHRRGMGGHRGSPSPPPPPTPTRRAPTRLAASAPRHARRDSRRHRRRRATRRGVDGTLTAPAPRRRRGRRRSSDVPTRCPARIDDRLVTRES